MRREVRRSMTVELSGPNTPAWAASLGVLWRVGCGILGGIILLEAVMIKTLFCIVCKHYEDGSLKEENPRCAAYPDGIPREIFDMVVGHDRPRPGDHGIQFEPKPGFEGWQASGSSD